MIEGEADGDILGQPAECLSAVSGSQSLAESWVLDCTGVMPSVYRSVGPPAASRSSSGPACIEYLPRYSHAVRADL